MRRTYLNMVLSIIATFFVNSILFGQNGTITGKVKYGKEALQAASVSLADKTTLTDQSGSFSISAKPGNYTITITHTGYKKIEQVIKVNNGDIKNFDFEMIPNDQLDEVVLVGSHSIEQRTNLNTPVPIDVFSEKKLVQTGQLGLIQMLNYLVPSFNAGRQDLNEPVTLRGLDPDHVLILVNENRYHNSAFLNNGTPKFSLGRGSVSNDLNSIPFSAIESAEILRDGASAQYGSDAIAGVINIRLKESTGKTTIQSHIGQYYAGDGLKVSLGFNRGFMLKKNGFLNFSADFRYQAPTTRAGEYLATVYKNYPAGSNALDSARIKAEDDAIIKSRGINKKEFSKYNGISQLISSGILINGAYPTGKHSEFFLTGSVNYRENHQAASYRF
ncbi:MAG TPA: TonB-dependent receptor, partial [Chitinophagaceae bacterium]|nr:TonB-dependent receptor [Chitinophagaceae bacterium]